MEKTFPKYHKPNKTIVTHGYGRKHEFYSIEDTAEGDIKGIESAKRKNHKEKNNCIRELKKELGAVKDLYARHLNQQNGKQS